MMSQAEARGGCEYYSLSADKHLGGRAMLRVLVPTSSGIVVTLPDAPLLRPGFGTLILINDHASNSLDLVSGEGEELGTLAAQKLVYCSLLPDLTWDLHVVDVRGKATA